MIRKATKQDTDKIMKIWLDASVKAHRFISEEFWKAHMNEVRDVYLPQAETFVYEDRHQLKGFISVILDNFIGALFVDTENQNQGIGTKLLEYVRQNRSSLTLKVYTQNEKALNFYQKNDFKIVAEKKDEQTGAEELILSWAQGCKNNRRLKSGQ